ncbi:MAG: 3-deoxy-8-phosphooctulonate synthase [Rhodospirillaceae bacterium]|nr:3-deoxy-8-phosphooctulonate synthase [Rhodospirillaceae bacterium]|tara:strand:+ start:1035 stop:1877 length:843 start_codon:yes stop_codon:yes gene_type:complete
MNIQNKTITLNETISISNDLPLTLIAGPCALESEEHAIKIATKLKNITTKLKINFIFKTSFDKANRTSITKARGIGIDAAIETFKEIKIKLQCPIITDVHLPEQCNRISEVVDIIQIPAFLCRQTDLLIAAARTNKIVNVKKGQFLAPWDMKNVIEKISDTGNKNILVTERGTSFGYNNLISDFKSLPILKSFGFPVVFDATHSVQQPGGKGDSSGGQREFISTLSKAAVSIGIAALFIETHDDPDNAPSDGPNMVPLDEMYNLIENLIEFDILAKKNKF